MNACRRGAAIVAVTVAAVTMTAFVNAPGASASSLDLEKSLIAFHNDTRAEYGLAPLRVSAELSSLARRYSQRMAEAGDVWHMPSLPSDVQDWRTLGDNVGMSNDLERLEAGFMDSPTHRSNILFPSYSLIGAGIVDVDGEIYVTVIFMKPEPPAVRPPVQQSPARTTKALKIGAEPETTVDILMQLAGMDAGMAA